MLGCGYYTHRLSLIYECVWDYVCARVDQASSADILQIVVRGLKAVRIQTSFVYIEYVQNYYREGRGLFNMRLVKEYGLYYTRDSNKGSFHKFSAQ